MSLRTSRPLPWSSWPNASPSIRPRKLGIPVPPFAPIDTPEDLQSALERIGLPAVLKTRRFGYDGKGQVVLHRPEDAAPALHALGGRNLILEGFVAFEREVSILAARGR